MDLALKGINYFQTYYQNLLLFAVSVSMIGWIFFLYQQLDIDIVDPTADQKSKTSKKSAWNWAIVCLLIVLFIVGKYFFRHMSLSVLFILS